MYQTKIWFGDYLFDPKYSDVLSDFMELESALKFKVVASSGYPDKICLVNFRFKELRKLFLLRLRIPRQNATQIITEPSVTVPFLYFPFVWNAFFSRRVFLGAHLRTPLPPIEKPYLPPKDVTFMKRGNRKNRAVLVNSNKFSWLQGELYSLRRQVASECVQLDVFGSGWQKSKLRTFVEALKEFVRAIPMIARLRLFDHNRYLSRQPLAYFGRVDDKIQKCSEYKVALVIENSLEMLTEKIHDAWFAGCIPVYVGPDLSDRGIPGDLYFSSEPVSDSILETISRVIHEVDHAEFCKKVDQWIRSSDYSRLFGYVPGWGRALDVGSG